MSSSKSSEGKVWVKVRFEASGSEGHDERTFDLPVIHHMMTKVYPMELVNKKFEVLKKLVPTCVTPQTKKRAKSLSSASMPDLQSLHPPKFAGAPPIPAVTEGPPPKAAGAENGLPIPTDPIPDLTAKTSGANGEAN